MPPWLRAAADFGTAETHRWAGILSRRLWLAGFVLVSLLLAVEALMVAGAGVFLSLLQRLEPWQAGLIVGSGLLLVAGLGLAVAVSLLREPKARAPSSPASRPVSPPLPNLLQSTAGEVADRAGLKLSDVLVAALVAGLVAGARQRRGRS